MILHALEHAFMDTIKLVPFLFVTYLVMEYLEHHAAGKTRQIMERSGKLGPLFGASVGLFPQCGFSAAAANLYAARVISRGTLIAVFLSTSDEMLPILLSERVDISVIAKLLGIKFVVGMLAGFTVDGIKMLIRHRRKDAEKIHELCEQENCDCEAGMLSSAIRHTIHIVMFLFVATVILNVGIEWIGEDVLAAFMQNRPFLSVALTALAGLIPNCVASVLMTRLYLQGLLTLGAAMAGLLVGSGVGILVLFRMNRDRRTNWIVVGLVYLVGLLTGLLLNVL
ncbi:MAG: arsenic efflux protein [Lachnospiraceae bacterium]|nr:arsenic efflux protein [Lachnospiraceae bacterium]